MKLLLEKEQVKVQNFVEYLIENYNEPGKTYEFEIRIEDKYDKKLVEHREETLEGKVLLLHDSGFEVIGPDVKNDYETFMAIINQFTDNESIASKFTSDNFTGFMVNYSIRFIENIHQDQFNFSFIDLTK